MIQLNRCRCVDSHDHTNGWHAGGGGGGVAVQSDNGVSQKKRAPARKISQAASATVAALSAATARSAPGLQNLEAESVFRPWKLMGLYFLLKWGAHNNIIIPHLFPREPNTPF